MNSRDRFAARCIHLAYERSRPAMPPFAVVGRARSVQVQAQAALARSSAIGPRKNGQKSGPRPFNHGLVEKKTAYPKPSGRNSGDMAESDLSAARRRKLRALPDQAQRIRGRGSRSGAERSEVMSDRRLQTSSLLSILNQLEKSDWRRARSGCTAAAA